MKKEKAQKEVPAKQVEAWREEVDALRAEIKELKKGGDTDALNAVMLRLEAIEKKLSDAPKKASLPGGVEITLPSASAGSAATAKPKETPKPQEPVQKSDDGGLFY